MNYSIKRIIHVVSSYIFRNILHDVKREFVILDLTNSLLGRILPDTEESNIISILGNDFADYTNGFLHTVEEFKNMPPDTVLTKYGLTKSRFTYFWGIKEGKLVCDKLSNLPDDLEVMPVRNWKQSYGRIIEAKCDNKSISLYFVDEFGNEIRYPQTGNVTKSLLIGPKHQLFLSCNPCWDMREYSQKINMFLQDNPSYLVQLDNGRFEHCQTDKINKAAYVYSSFQDYQDIFIFGELLNI